MTTTENNTIQEVTRTIPELYNATRRFTSNDEKRIFNEFRPYLVNRYLGWFVTDSNYNFKKGDKYLHDASEGTMIMLNEIVQWSVAVVDRTFADNNQLESIFWGGVKRYIYMVDKELYDQLKPADPNNRPPIVGSDQYPGIRIFESYEVMLRYLENKFRDQNIFILSEEALYNMKYFLKGIHIVKSNSLNVSGTKFPFEFYQSFMGISHSNKEGLFRLNESNVAQSESEVISEHAEHEATLASLFGGNVKVTSESRQKLKKSITSKQFSYELMYAKPHWSPTNVIHRIAKRSHKHYSYANVPADCLRVMVIKTSATDATNDIALIYDRRFDIVIDAKPVEHLGKDLVYAHDKPYIVAITNSFMQSTSIAKNELDLFSYDELHSFMIDNHIQIQTR